MIVTTPRLLLILVSAAMCLLSILVMPLTMMRSGEDWRKPSRVEADKPISVIERYRQFNTDIEDWVYVTQGWPHVHKEYELRSNRPLYPAVSAFISRSINVFATWPPSLRAFGRDPHARQAFTVMLAVNCALAIATVLLFFSWIGRHLPKPEAFLSSLLFATAAWWLWRINQVATSVVALFIIVVVLLVFDSLLRRRDDRWPAVLGAGILIGTLMLAKQQYDVLMLCWAWALLHRRFKIVVGTLLIHLLPLATWYYWLTANGYTYYSHETAQYGQGVWIWQSLAAGDLGHLVVQTLKVLKVVGSNLVPAFSPAMVALAFLGAAFWKHGRDFRNFLLLGVVVVVGFLVLIQRPKPYLVFDMFFAVLPFASVGILLLVRRAAVIIAPGEVASRRLKFALVTLLLAVLVPLSWWHSMEDRYMIQPAFGEFDRLVGYFMFIDD